MKAGAKSVSKKILSGDKNFLDGEWTYFYDFSSPHTSWRGPWPELLLPLYGPEQKLAISSAYASSFWSKFDGQRCGSLASV